MDLECYSSNASTPWTATDIKVTKRIFKEGRSYVAHALELDVSSCGGKAKALKSLRVAVNLFLEEADNMGTLEQILQEAPI